MARGAELYLLSELTAKDISGRDPNAAYIREPTRERYKFLSAGLSSHSSFSSHMLGSRGFDTLRLSSIPNRFNRVSM
jgi:hypothetical protein